MLDALSFAESKMTSRNKRIVIEDEDEKKESLQPTFEVVKPVCTCGKKFSDFVYRTDDREGFLQFAQEYNIDKRIVELMNFRQGNLKDMKQYIRGTSSSSGNHNFKLCCLKTIRTGTVYPITSPLFQKIEYKDTDGNDAIPNRRYPEALAGPFSVQRTLYWAV